MEPAPELPVTTQEPTNYAGFLRRLGALILDILILSVPAYLLAYMLGDYPSAKINKTACVAETPYFTIYKAASFLLNWLYFALLESSGKQATLGKQALGLYVTDTSGARLSFVKATVRHFGKFISAITLFIGFLMAAFTARKQALHDLLAGTLVLRK